MTTMAPSFPLSTAFEGLKGLVHITVTADATDAPELIHLANEAGAACAHLAVHEWDHFTAHVSSLLHTHDSSPTPADAPVTPVQPFPAPEDTATQSQDPQA